MITLSSLPAPQPTSVECLGGFDGEGRLKKVVFSSADRRAARDEESKEPHLNGEKNCVPMGRTGHSDRPTRFCPQQAGRDRELPPTTAHVPPHDRVLHAPRISHG